MTKMKKCLVEFVEDGDGIIIIELSDDDPTLLDDLEDMLYEAWRERQDEKKRMDEMTPAGPTK